MTQYNVVLIVLDDISPSKLSFYEEDTVCANTPVMNSLAANGIVFRNAYAMPICGPTRTSLFTGRNPFRHGHGCNIVANEYELPDSEILIPEMIRRTTSSGVYKCGAFGKWHSGTATSDDLHPLRNGFHEFHGCMSNDLPSHWIWRKVNNGVSTNISAPPYDETTWSASHAKRDAVTWINAQPNKFFAYVGFNPPHADYSVPPSTLHTVAGLPAPGTLPTTPEQIFSYYDANLESVDTLIGQIMSEMDSVKLANTVFIIVGDNGTESSAVEPPADPSKYKRSVYQGGIRVPLIISGPIVVNPGRFTNQLVSVVDLFGFIAECTGANTAIVTATRHLDSMDIMPVIQDTSSILPRQYLFAQMFKPSGLVPHTSSAETMIKWPYKLIVTGSAQEFYKLDDDPTEVNNLIDSLTPDQVVIYQDILDNMTALISSGN